MNVRLSGWTDSPIYLFASLLELPTLAVGALDETPQTRYALLAYLSPETGWVIDHYEPIPAAHPHFPYGLGVFPD